MTYDRGRQNEKCVLKVSLSKVIRIKIIWYTNYELPIDIDHVAFEDKKMLIYVEMKIVSFFSSNILLNDVTVEWRNVLFEWH